MEKKEREKKKMSFRVEGESVFSNTLMSFFYNCEFDRNYKLNRVLKKDVI